jgi:anti-sigma-K factor RskA
MSDRFSDETLRDYAKGRLTGEDAAAIEAAARADAALAAEIALIRGVVKAGEDTARSAPSPELGWARLSRAIDAETGAPRSFIPRQFSRWQAAAVAAIAVAVWSAVAMPFLQQQEEPGGYVTANERPAYAHSAQATFVPTAQEGAIREALRAAEADIVQGPSALGVYVLAFKDAEALDKGAAALRTRTDLFETVEAN